MSSLLSLIAKNGRFIQPSDKPEAVAGFVSLYRNQRERILDQHTKRILFTEQVKGTARNMVDDGGDITMTNVPNWMPPFEWSWFEFNSGDNVGYLVQREESAGPLCYVTVTLYLRRDNLPVPSFGAARFALNPDGSFPVEFTGHQWIYSDLMKHYCGNRDPQDLLQGWLLFLGHAISMLHCKNVSLNVEGPKRLRPQKGRLPDTTVWHTIKVSDHGPQVRAMGPAVNCREYRSHWVRGHFADYTKGNGLFGKHKGLFWIPEHQRGDEENGKVIADYEVE